MRTVQRTSQTRLIVRDGGKGKAGGKTEKAKSLAPTTLDIAILSTKLRSTPDGSGGRRKTIDTERGRGKTGGRSSEKIPAPGRAAIRINI